MLRATQLGLTMEDLDALDEGMVIDMLIEAANDQEEYDIKPTQADIDRIFG